MVFEIFLICKIFKIFKIKKKFTKIVCKKIFFRAMKLSPMGKNVRFALLQIKSRGRKMSVTQPQNDHFFRYKWPLEQRRKQLKMLLSSDVYQPFHGHYMAYVKNARITCRLHQYQGMFKSRIMHSFPVIVRGRACVGDNGSQVFARCACTTISLSFKAQIWPNS